MTTCFESFQSFAYSIHIWATTCRFKIERITSFDSFQEAPSVCRKCFNIYSYDTYSICPSCYDEDTDDDIDETDEVDAHYDPELIPPCYTFAPEWTSNN